MDFEGIMLNEINQIEKHCIISYIHVEYEKKKMFLEAEQIGG